MRSNRPFDSFGDLLRVGIAETMSNGLKSLQRPFYYEHWRRFNSGSCSPIQFLDGSHVLDLAIGDVEPRSPFVCDIEPIPIRLG